MIRNHGKRVGRLLAGVGVLMLSAVAAWGDQPPVEPRPRILGTLVGPEGIVAERPVNQIKLSDYWLGLMFHYPVEVKGALRAQLGLPDGQGLLVDEVVAEGPAAGAGVKQHDILLKADGKPLGTLENLIGAVDAAKDKEMTLDVLRAGKPKEIRITPVKRPERVRDAIRRPNPADPALGRFYEWFERERPGWEGRPPWRFRLFSPGAILPLGAPGVAPLPGNLSISIKKEGGKPARIEIRRDDEQWEIDENGLEQLPADVRVHVRRMLNGVSVNVDVPGGVVPEAHVEGPLGGFAWPRVPNLPPDGRLEKRLDEMNRHINELRKTIEQFREKRLKEKTPEKKAIEAEPQSI